MNAFKLNGIAGHQFRQAVCKGLDIPMTEIYKTVKSIDSSGIIETKNGERHQLELKKITKEAVNNFNLIRSLLSFDSEDEFYFVQILQRKKDNPDNINGSNNSSRLIKAYYINSFEKFDSFQNEMIFFANHFNARVGINLNKRSYYKTAFNTLRHIAEQMHNKNFKNVKRAWNTCCGVHNGGDKIWLLDVDDADNWDLEHGLIKFIRQAQPLDKKKILAKIPSRSGYHFITKGFDTRGFSEQFPNVEIHKNNPTNLYIP